MKQFKYSFVIFIAVVLIFLLGWASAAFVGPKLVIVAFIFSGLLAFVFYIFLEKRIVKLSNTINSKRSSDIKTRHPGPLRKALAGSLLDVELKVHRLKKTQRKIIDDLAQEKNKLSAILLQMIDGIMMLDEEDKILFYNPAFEKILGIDQVSHNMQGAFMGEMVFRPQLLELLDRLKFEHKPIEEHISFFDKSEPKYVHVQMRRLGDKNHLKTLISIQDVSKDKAAEKQRNTMVENISHELRTPLTVVLGHLDILSNTTNSTEQESYGKIRENVERMIVLTEEILKASQWKQKRLEKNNVAFDPMSTIKSVVENYQNIAQAKGIVLSLKSEASLSKSDNSCLIEGNEDQFYQVIQNLVDNSIKYTASGKVNVVTQIKGSRFVVSVSDTGLGIEPHEKKNIFKRFYRIDKARKESGTGLGLSIVKSYLDQWSVQWSVDSKLKEGTQFYIEFDRVDALINK